MIKVRNGTIRTDVKDLCSSCSWAIRRTDFNGQLIVKCTHFEIFLKQPTVECTSYDDKSKTSLDELYKTAWILHGNSKGKIGFSPMKELPEEEQRKIRGY